jgi:hypothetical protein
MTVEGREESNQKSMMKLKMKDEKHFRFIPEKNLLIECQRIQHYEVTSVWKGNSKKLKYKTKHNQMKRNFCKEEHLQRWPLLEVNRQQKRQPLPKRFPQTVSVVGKQR